MQTVSLNDIFVIKLYLLKVRRYIFVDNKELTTKWILIKIPLSAN